MLSNGTGGKEAFEIRITMVILFGSLRVFEIPTNRSVYVKQQTTAKVSHETSSEKKITKILTRHFWVCVFFFVRFACS